MYDLLLINPGLSEIRSRDARYRFAYAASGHGYMPLFAVALVPWVRQAGFLVKFLDMELYSPREEAHLLALYAPMARWVGLSVMTAQVPQALALSRQVRKIAPHAKVLWGGIHPTLLPEQTVAHPAVDYVVVGEGEEPLRALLRGEDHPRIGTKAKKPDPAAGVPYLPVDELPDPDYGAVEMDRYFLFQGDYRNVDVLTSRGCPFRCSFCVNTIVKNRWRGMPVARSVALVAQLQRTYRIRHVFFEDENFFGQVERAASIIEGIAGLGITWEANICVRDVLKLEEAFWQRMRASGAVRLRMGAESGSDRMLKILNKGTTRAQIVAARDRCLAFGITPLLSFMIHLPDEQPEEEAATIQLARESAAAGAIVLGPQPFRPYPGSQEFEKLVARGLRLPASLEEWCSSDLFEAGMDGTPGGRKLRALYHRLFPRGRRRTRLVQGLRRWLGQ